MKYAAWLSAIFTIGVSLPAHAEPSQTDIVDALENAGFAVHPSRLAHELEGCERVAGQPGYVCSFSYNECIRDDGEIEELCDNPGVSQRAIFIGGDNGWLALDVLDPHTNRSPRIPLAARPVEPSEEQFFAALHEAGVTSAPQGAGMQFDGCETIAGRPAYSCNYRADTCYWSADGNIHDCGFLEERRAILIGGGGRWVAVADDHRELLEAAVPNGALAGRQSRLDASWLAGTWGSNGDCVRGGAHEFRPDGSYRSGGQDGRWSLGENRLTITALMIDQASDEGLPQPVVQARGEMLTVERLGRNAATLNIEGGQPWLIVRC